MNSYNMSSNHLHTAFNLTTTLLSLVQYEPLTDKYTISGPCSGITLNGAYHRLGDWTKELEYPGVDYADGNIHLNEEEREILLSTFKNIYQNLTYNINMELYTDYTQEWKQEFSSDDLQILTVALKNVVKALSLIHSKKQGR